VSLTRRRSKGTGSKRVVEHKGAFICYSCTFSFLKSKIDVDSVAFGGVLVLGRVSRGSFQDSNALLYLKALFPANGLPFYLSKIYVLG
jgi:hypothetical protein